MSKNILASSIAHKKHFAAFDEIYSNRLDQIELDKLLVYIIDTVDASALNHLATQFDILGYKGLKLADTVEKKRELIKRAIELKRYSGTIYAVQEALKSIGYPDAIITENVGDDPEHGWAEFRIDINGGVNEISPSKLDELLKMVRTYKGLRNHLKDISYTIDLGSDDLILSDEGSLNPSIDEADSIKAGGDNRHNGILLRNGSMNYSNDTDVLEIDIITI